MTSADGHATHAETLTAADRSADPTDRRTTAALIVNPYSSGMTAKREREIVQLLSEHSDVELLRTERPAHASELAADAVTAGVDVVIACGGDGTGNEVLSGMSLEHDSAGRRPAFALIPAGGTNVLCRSLGMPNNPIAATRQLAPALAHVADRSRSINLGQLDERIFMFSAGIGFDGEVVKRIDAKRKGRRPSDLAHVVTMVGMFASQRWVYRDGITITVPETGEELRVCLVMIGNTSPMSYAGRIPLNFMPDCSLETGLDFVAPTKQNAVAAIRNGMRAMGLGKAPTKRPELQLHHDLAEFTVVCDEPQPIQVDGEYLGERTHIQLTSLRNCVRIIV